MNKLKNIQEYIDSGILEQYVLGMTTPEQNREIQSYSALHPEIKAEIEQIESTLENYTKAYSKPLPDSFISKVLEKIKSEPIHNSSKSKTWLNYLLGLTVIGLIIALYSIWKLNQEANQKISQLEHEFTFYKAKSESDSLSLLDCSNQLIFLRSQSAHKIILKGTPKSPQSFATIYYDKDTKRTLVDVIDLPTPPKEKQYQLWAIVGGKPIDLGVFDLDTTQRLKEIKFIEEVQAFAITLEPKGGLPSPSMDMMFVIGSIQ